MPLTAYDPDTGQVALATWPVSSPQCKDPNCRAKMHVVRGTDVRVQHFRHSTHCTSPTDHVREREQMSPWHMWWQSQCSDPARIEVTDVNTSGDSRRADILTPFGWCVEVQHSAIAAKTIRARENHWNGKVLWLVDAASDDRQVDFSVDARSARLDGVWVHHLSTLIAVDDGQLIWMFPWVPLRSAGEIRTNAKYARRISHEGFIATWINGEHAPFNKEPETSWRRGAREAVKRSQGQRELRELAARQRALGELRQGEVICEYTGSPDRLIHEAPVAAPGPMPPPTVIAPEPVHQPASTAPEPTPPPTIEDCHPDDGSPTHCEICGNALMLRRIDRTTCARCLPVIACGDQIREVAG